MNYYVHDIETANARIFNKRHYQFDYIEPDSFEKMQINKDLSVIGCIKLKEIEKEETTDKIVIPSGLTDHYFKLMPPNKRKHLRKKHLIGYILVSRDNYVAVYKHSILMPLLLSLAFLATFCAIIL